MNICFFTFARSEHCTQFLFCLFFKEKSHFINNMYTSIITNTPLYSKYISVLDWALYVSVCIQKTDTRTNRDVFGNRI